MMHDRKNSFVMPWYRRKDILVSSSKIFIIVLLLICWFVILMKAFSRLELNSDMSGMVIEANEILSGNFFLRGRELTGLTFLPTDLLFFVIGALFFGMSGKTYIIAVMLMYAASSSAVLLIMRYIYIYI